MPRARGGGACRTERMGPEAGLEPALLTLPSTMAPPTPSGSPPGTPPTGPRSSSATDDAKRAAGETADEAKTAAADVAQTAKAAASDVADTAVGTAKDLAGQAAQQAESAAADKKSQAAGVLDDASSALHGAADSLRDDGRDAFARYAEQAAGQVEQFTSTVRDKNVGELLDEAERFARREPGLFIGGAFLLGIVGARFLKASSSEAGPDRSSAHPTPPSAGPRAERSLPPSATRASTGIGTAGGTAKAPPPPGRTDTPTSL